MSSFESRLLSIILKASGAGNILSELALTNTPEAFMQAVSISRKKDMKSPPEKMAKNYTIQTTTIDGFSLHILRRKDQKGNGILLYLHGGAYCVGPSSLHWDMLDAVSRLAQVDFAVLDYPKIPEHSVEETMAVALNTFHFLLDQLGAEQITLMGDSAGGGLALALCMELVSRSIPTPKRLILFSPWLDVSMSHPQARDYELKDQLLNCNGLSRCGAVYAGALDAHHPWVSPRFGQLTGLPHVHLFSGGQEVFWPDIRDFSEELRNAGLETSLYYQDEMPHTFPLFWMMPSGKRALEQVATILV